jgi:NADH-quinone oxidoreductase subunit C
MADEQKPASSPPPGNGQGPGEDKQSGAVEAVPPSEKGAPAGPTTPPKAAAPVPAKPTGPVPVAWESTMVARFKRQYGSGIEALTYLGQNYMVVDRSLIPNLLWLLRDEEKFDYCVDITAVHYPKREKQFDVVWILYSFEKNERVRVKIMIGENESLPSSVEIWPTCNWLEREVFDMFGIRFEGHPDLKRILLPEGWSGHPLRKDYGIIQQDKEWVQINLGIESGQ